MNIFWWYWLQRGGFFRAIHRSPLAGHLDSKSWSDTHVIKKGKATYEVKDNGWDDDEDGEGKWND